MEEDGKDRMVEERRADEYDQEKKRNKKGK